VYPDNEWPEDAPEPPAGPTPAPQPLPEAPASCNVYVLIDGHKARLVMVSFTYMRSEADRVLTPLPLVLAFAAP